MDGAIVLGHVKIDSEGPQSIGHFLIGCCESLLVIPGKVLRNNAVFLSVVAQEIEHGVREVGLKSEGIPGVGQFESPQHPFPTVHSTPANFAFRSQPLPVVGRDVGRFPKSPGDKRGVALGVLAPGFHVVGRIDANDTIGAHTQITQLRANRTGLAHLGEEFFSILPATHG